MKKTVRILAAMSFCIAASVAQATTIDLVRTGNTLNFTVTNDAGDPFTACDLAPRAYSSFTESSGVFGATSVYSVSFTVANALPGESLRFAASDGENNVMGFSYIMPELEDVAPVADSAATIAMATPAAPADPLVPATPAGAADPAASQPDNGAAPVPEPGTFAFMGAGLGCLALYRRRK